MIIIAIDTCDQRHFCRTSFNNSRGHSYTEAAQEEDDYDERDAHRYEAADDYYSTPFSSPLKRPVDMSQRYAQVDIGDNSFEACQLSSPQKRATKTSVAFNAVQSQL